MNGNPAKIEIFAPFQTAYEWMKTMLFRPFDIANWLTVAFAAFLSGNLGGGANFGRLGRLGGGDWRYSATKHGDLPADWNFLTWGIALLVIVVLFAIILAVVWMWIASRGRFIFTDCLVKQHGAIVEPWREFRREGNSYFLFSLAVAFAMVMATIIIVVIAWALFAMVSGGEDMRAGAVAVFVVILIFLGLLWLLVVLFFALVSHFMVPVMYRRRCSAREAFLDVTKLIFHQPVPFILFVLFGIVLALAVAVIGTTVACLTCCIGGLPYISTVLLLPAIVWLATFRLMFFRQFGEQYDVWAATGSAAPAIEPSSPNSPA